MKPRLSWNILLIVCLAGTACQTTDMTQMPSETPDTSPMALAKPIVPAAYLAADEADTPEEPVKPDPQPEPVDPGQGEVTPNPDPPKPVPQEEPCNDIIRKKVRNLENEILTLNRDIKLTNDADQRQAIRSEIRDYETRLNALRKRYNCF